MMKTKQFYIQTFRRKAFQMSQYNKVVCHRIEQRPFEEPI